MTCRIVKEYSDERVADAMDRVVDDLLRDGSLSVEKISVIAKVPLERVKQMAEQIAAQA